LKNLSFFIASVLIVSLFFSCNKEQVDEKISLSSALEPLVDESPNYIVKDGILCFNSAEDFIKLNDKLSTMNLDEISEWEKSIGFTSFRTEYFAITERMDTVSDLNESKQILYENRDIIYEKDGILYPVIEQTSYQRTANRNGIFVINDVVSKVTNEELLVFEGFCAESLLKVDSKNLDLSKCTKRIALEDEIKYKSTYCDSYIDKWSDANTDGTRHKKCEIIAKVRKVVLSSGDDTFYKYEITCTSVSWAKDLIGNDYDQYKSVHYMQPLEIVVEAPKTCCSTGGFSIQEVTYTMPYSDTGSTESNKKIWIDGKRIGDYAINQNIPDPEFKRIKGIFWTRGSADKKVQLNCGYAY
jgi:hypothetical protein